METGGPAAEGIPTGHFPTAIVPAGHVAPVPRRVRALLDGHMVLDTCRAMYGWEHPYYPQFHIPSADVDAACLRDDGARTDEMATGSGALRTLLVGDREHPAAAWFLDRPSDPALQDHYRFVWGALDSWWEEEEQVFVHPRSPYARADALRSSGHLLVRAGGVVLAEATAWVTVFETGLPPRAYLDPGAVDMRHLEPSPTRTSCPYKGRTTGYWSARTPEGIREDIAWSYGFPTSALMPIAGLIGFLGEQVEILRDGVPLA